MTSNTHSKDIKNTFFCSAVSFVPKLTKDHDRIILFRHNVKKFTFKIQQKVFKLAALVSIKLHYNQIRFYGIIF